MGGFGSDFDGIPVGDALYVSRRLDEKLQEAKKCMDAIDEAINNEAQQGQDRLRQTAYMLHRACSSGKLSHLLRCSYPSDIAAAAAEFDATSLNRLVDNPANRGGPCSEALPRGFLGTS